MSPVVRRGLPIACVVLLAAVAAFASRGGPAAAARAVEAGVAHGGEASATLLAPLPQASSDGGRRDAVVYDRVDDATDDEAAVARALREIVVTEEAWLPSTQLELPGRIVVQLVPELTGVEIALRVEPLDGSAARDLAAFADVRGVAAFDSRLAAPARLLLRTSNWLGPPAELGTAWPSEKTLRFDARQLVGSASLSVSGEPGDERLAASVASLVDGKSSGERIGFYGSSAPRVVRFAAPAIAVRVSETRHRDHDLELTAGHYHVVLAPGIPVDFVVEGLAGREPRGILSLTDEAGHSRLLDFRESRTTVLLAPGRWTAWIHVMGGSDDTPRRIDFEVHAAGERQSVILHPPRR